MKRFFSALLLMLLMISPAFSLSDSEYLRMRKSSTDFSRADKRLNNTWNHLRRTLPKKIFTQLDKLQREWIKSGRDEDAAALMEEGYSRAEAYTMATNDRADSLPKIAKELRESQSREISRAPSRRTQSRNEEDEPEPPRRNRTRRSQEDDSESEPVRRTQRVRTEEPEPEQEPEIQPAKTQEPEPEPEPEPEESVTLRASEIEGEYQNDSGFVSVRLTDINTDEMEVTFSRFKDGVHWTVKGWLDNNTLELSDMNYSDCQATLKFSRGSVKVEITETDDWNEAVSPDFVLKGTYRKLAN